MSNKPPIEQCDFGAIIREEMPQAERIARWMAQTHPSASVLDVGCGPGIYVKAMREAGLDAYGVDGDPRLVEDDYCWRVDFRYSYYDFKYGYERVLRVFADAPSRFDVVMSLEVGEHIEHAWHNKYVDFIACMIPGIVYFSAARPGQGGHGHIACEPKSYWIKHFHRAGFWLDIDATDAWLNFMRAGPHMGWLTQNGMVFRAG
jgi:SAM-dependent methyltransferase